MAISLNPFAGSGAESKYKEMHEMFLHDDIKEAIKLGEQIHHDHPEHEKTIMLLAQLHLQSNHHDKADERFTKMLDKHPSHTEARMGRAQARYLGYEFELALDDYLTLYENAFNDTQYLISLGDCYQKLDLQIIARRYYTRAVSQAPTHIEAILALGYHYLLIGWRKHADEQAKKAKELYYENKYDYDSAVEDNIRNLEKEIKQVMLPALDQDEPEQNSSHKTKKTSPKTTKKTTKKKSSTSKTKKKRSSKNSSSRSQKKSS